MKRKSLRLWREELARLNVNLILSVAVILEVLPKLAPHPQTTPITLPYKTDRQGMKSFFAGTSRSEDDWFLMQLPTRLPKVAAYEPPKEGGLDKDDNPEETMTTTQPEMVSTKPTLDTAFDNSLAKAKWLR